MENLNDTDIIEQVLNGDTEAFAILVNRYSGVAYSFVCRICGSKEDAEEVVQDTFMKAYGNLKKFRKDSAFSSWLYRIAYNTAISHIRKNKKTRLTELHEERISASDDTATDFISREEQLIRLERALEKLAPEDRALIQLFYQKEKPVKEISEIMNLSEGNVKIRLHRIRKRLGVIYEKII